MTASRPAKYAEVLDDKDDDSMSEEEESYWMEDEEDDADSFVEDEEDDEQVETPLPPKPARRKDYNDPNYGRGVEEYHEEDDCDKEMNDAAMCAAFEKKNTREKSEDEDEDEDKANDDYEIVIDDKGLDRKQHKYDKRLEVVSQALQRAEPPAGFFTAGEESVFPLPGLVVEGVGAVPLPLTQSTVNTLVDVIRSIDGSRELIDSSRARDLSTRQISVANPAWDAFVRDEIVPSCGVPLGINEKVTVEARPQALVLEKADEACVLHGLGSTASGIFGKLIVILPGSFEGGDFTVSIPPSAVVTADGPSPCVWRPGKADQVCCVLRWLPVHYQAPGEWIQAVCGVQPGCRGGG